MTRLTANGDGKTDLMTRPVDGRINYNKNKLSHSFTPDAFRSRIIGFDSILDHVDQVLNSSMKRESNYPPFNILEIPAENENEPDKYFIEFALAGISIDDIEIVRKNPTSLMVSYKKKNDSKEENNNIRYNHKGISNREFTQFFTIPESTEVIEAKYEDGILSVYMEKQIPETEKPQSIPITGIKK